MHGSLQQEGRGGGGSGGGGGGEEARLAAEEEKKRENEIGGEGKEREQMRENYLCVVYDFMRAPLMTLCTCTWLSEDL